MKDRTCTTYDVLEFPHDTLARLRWLKEELDWLCPPDTVLEQTTRALELARSLHKRLYGLIIHKREFQLATFYTDIDALVGLLQTLIDAGVRLPDSYERPTSIPDISQLEYAEDLEYWRALAWRRARDPLICRAEQRRNAAFMRRLAKLKLPPRPHPLGWESED
jgi:hypothetical protein